MAKRGTLTHRRTRRLARLLRIQPPYALGVMEAVWHVAAEQAPRGDVGRLSNQDLCDEAYLEGNADEIVAALVEAGVLEEHSAFRLVVHGWSEHADRAVRHKLSRAGLTFWDDEPPFGRRSGADGETGESSQPPEPVSACTHERTASAHERTPSDDGGTRANEIDTRAAAGETGEPPQPTETVSACTHDRTAPAHEHTPADDGGTRAHEIAPVQCPASSVQRPVTSDQQPTEERTPPIPPAAAGGPAGGGGHSPGEILPDGREATDVDDQGRILAVKRSAPPPGTEPSYGELTKATARLATYRRQRWGYEMNREAQRAVRTRLRGGETEEQIRASWDRQNAALDEELPEPVICPDCQRPAATCSADPCEGAFVDKDHGLTQALRLLGPPALGAGRGAT